MRNQKSVESRGRAEKSGLEVLQYSEKPELHGQNTVELERRMVPKPELHGD